MTMSSSTTFSASARRVSIVAAIGTVVGIAVYAVMLLVGLASLASPQRPIGDPIFSLLELAIIVLMPLLVALMAAVHAWAPAGAKVYSLLAVVFMSLLAALTCSVHFVILVLSHRAEAAGWADAPLLLSFHWPSIPYALDILGWDVFFALSVLFAAPVFGGSARARAIRTCLIVSGVLALAGLAGPVLGDMRWRMIGVVGYVGVFPVAAALMGVLFRAAPATAR